MKSFSISLRIICLFLFTGSSLAAAGLQGDSKALARVDAMLESLGGKEVWSSARSLYTMERARHFSYGDGIIATFWRDLDNPGEYGKLKHKKLNVTYAWNGREGWIERDGEVRDFSEEEIDERNFYWSREIYTLYHWLADGEHSLTVKVNGANGFTVIDESGVTLGDFKLTPKGDLYMWKQHGGEHPVAYIYGPNKDYGSVSFPDWGTATDGKWGFYYLQVRPSSQPFTFHAKPKTHWDGGAVNQVDCSQSASLD